MQSVFPFVRELRSASLSAEDRIGLLVNMVRIRVFEEAIADLQLERDAADKACRECPDSLPYPEEKRIRTPCHLSIGQEAVAAGVCAVLRKEDWIWSTHRSHGHYLAKGGDLRKGLAEIFCRSTGCSKGRGGSMHLCDPSVGMLGTSSIVAGCIPLGVGAALAEYVRGTDKVSVLFFGDAVPEEGVFHESLNWAILLALPVIFCLEDNQYSTHLHIKFRRKNTDLSKVLAGYGLPIQDVDGNDVEATLAAAEIAVERARRQGGPSLLHLHTYRWRGHVGPYDNLEVGLRSEEEIKLWMSKCPIARERNRLVSEGIVTERDIADIMDQVRSEIGEALQEALKAPRPVAEELGYHVFKEL